MSTTQTSPDRASTISPNEEPLRYLLRVVLVFLRKVFASAPEGGYYFNENDPDTSRVMITSDIPIAADVIGERPHIVAFFSGVQWQGVGIDQLAALDFSTGSETHQDIITGNLTISTLTRNGDEATFITFHIGTFLWALRKILLRSGFHDIGQRINVTPPTSPGQLVSNDLDGEIISVNAIVPFSFPWTVTVTGKDDYLLKEIDMTLQQQFPSMYPSQQERNSTTLDMVGTATHTVGGNKPKRYPTKDITKRRVVAVSTLDDEREPISKELIIGSEEQ